MVRQQTSDKENGAGIEGKHGHRRIVPRRAHPLDDYYQSLLTLIRSRDRGGRSVATVGVIGCLHGEGVSTISSNLAVMAASHVRGGVLLIDANTKRPQISRMFGVQTSPGFVEVLAGMDPRSCVSDTTVSNLSILSAGDSGIAADVPVAAGMLKELRQEYEFIVVDLPPAAETGSLGYLLASALDGVLLVMECERTRLDAAQKAKEKLLREKANVLGVVFNKQRRRMPAWLRQRL